ncbi:MAG TPA: hypothetical protein VF166_10405 [Gemmatimonadaceae bacterium]
MLTTSTLWDFADILIPGQAGPVDLGATETISLDGHGSIVASSGDVLHHVTVKGGNLPLDASERGLGLCHPGTKTTCSFPADGDEVGDGGPGTLLLNFNGVEPAGSMVREIGLASLQANEGYRYAISTDGGATFGAETEVFPNNPDTLATLTIDQPAAGLVVKLEKTVATGSPDDDYDVRTVTTEFTTTPLQGRLTGGGVKAAGADGETVTLGLTLHCDILLSNNLEINWQGHQWHLTKPITSASCSNQQNDAPPPASPIDTFVGTAFGTLDGVKNSKIEFNFQDHGEPGTNDMVELTIYEPGSSTVALNVPLQAINVGNLQMHYDQPHGSHP